MGSKPPSDHLEALEPASASEPASVAAARRTAPTTARSPTPDPALRLTTVRTTKAPNQPVRGLCAVPACWGSGVVLDPQRRDGRQDPGAELFRGGLRARPSDQRL